MRWHTSGLKTSSHDAVLSLCVSDPNWNSRWSCRFNPTFLSTTTSYWDQKDFKWSLSPTPDNMRIWGEPMTLADKWSPCGPWRFCGGRFVCIWLLKPSWSHRRGSSRLVRERGDEKFGAALTGQESAVRAGPFAVIHRNLRNGESCGLRAN